MPTPAEIAAAAQAMASSFKQNNYLRYSVARKEVKKISSELVLNPVAKKKGGYTINKDVRDEFNLLCPDAVFHPNPLENRRHWSVRPVRPRRKSRRKSK